MRKLEEIAQAEEKKLELAEQYLEEDAALFDEFLKENDRNASEAIKVYGVFCITVYFVSMLAFRFYILLHHFPLRLPIFYQRLPPEWKRHLVTPRLPGYVLWETTSAIER